MLRRYISNPPIYSLTKIVGGLASIKFQNRNLPQPKKTESHPMKKFALTMSVVVMMLSPVALPVNAQFLSVLDYSAILAWASQYTQMASQLVTMSNQLTQLTSFNSNFGVFSNFSGLLSGGLGGLFGSITGDIGKLDVGPGQNVDFGSIVSGGGVTGAMATGSQYMDMPNELNSIDGSGDKTTQAAYGIFSGGGTPYRIINGVSYYEDSTTSYMLMKYGALSTVQANVDTLTSREYTLESVHSQTQYSLIEQIKAASDESTRTGFQALLQEDQWQQQLENDKILEAQQAVIAAALRAQAQQGITETVDRGLNVSAAAGIASSIIEPTISSQQSLMSNNFSQYDPSTVFSTPAYPQNYGIH